MSQSNLAEFCLIVPATQNAKGEEESHGDVPMVDMDDSRPFGVLKLLDSSSLLNDPHPESSTPLNEPLDASKEINNDRVLVSLVDDGRVANKPRNVGRRRTDIWKFYTPVKTTSKSRLAECHFCETRVDANPKRQMRSHLRACNAFKEPQHATLREKYLVQFEGKLETQPRGQRNEKQLVSITCQTSDSKTTYRTVKFTSRGIKWSDDEVENRIQTARERIGNSHSDIIKWRRQIHSFPELAFQEKHTAHLVESLLLEWGIEVRKNIGGTGLVGILRNGNNLSKEYSIMLRADMDALPLYEKNEFDHKSKNNGIMHACGHDGHTAMLLGAAQYLSKNKNFEGTVYFVFQPAEEGTPTVNEFNLSEGGALAMINDGLLQKFPVRAAFGLHNWPGLPVGEIAIHSNSVMAGVDNFDIKVEGIGFHAAMPHLGMGSDVVVCLSQIVLALQSLISRSLNPIDCAVLSVTQIHSGEAYNILSPFGELKGTLRTFKEETRSNLILKIKKISEDIASAFGCKVDVKFHGYFPATINSKKESELCNAAAIKIVGKEKTNFDTMPPSMGGEDFGWILKNVPGCYIWLGNGPTEGGCMLHNPLYDFNDDILALGVCYWIQLVEEALPLSK